MIVLFSRSTERNEVVIGREDESQYLLMKKVNGVVVLEKSYSKQDESAYENLEKDFRDLEHMENCDY